MSGVAKHLNGRISVLLAEASPMVGELIAGALKRCPYRFNVVASTNNSLDTIKKLEALDPNVAVVSTKLQDGPLAGFKVLHQVRALRLKTAAIMLLDSGDRDLVVDAFRGGARGVFYRGYPFKALSKCIRTVHDGQVWASNGDVGLVAEGMKNRDIALKLTVTEQTVKNYVFRIFEKLGVSSRVELVLYALTRPDSDQLHRL